MSSNNLPRHHMHIVSSNSDQCLQSNHPLISPIAHNSSQQSVNAKFVFFYDWGCDSPFWCGNDVARAKFDVGSIEPEALGLSTQTSERIRALAQWHDTALNWTYPSAPSPWRQQECERFNAAVDSLLETVRAELSEEYELIDRQWRASEDLDLDQYLADPEGFRH
jgi:hypothetical protein